jgi:uncharacterized protein YkwD
MPAVLSLLISAAALAQVVQKAVEKDDTEVLKPMPGEGEPPKSPDLADTAKRVVQLTNEFREKEEHDEVELDPKLTKAAQGLADYMARTSRFGHKADGTTPADRARKSGYAYCIIAENIAYELNSRELTAEDLAQALFDGWKAPPGHRRNLLDEDVVETGVAVAHNSKTGYFLAVQMFGRPQSKTLEFSIANESATSAEYKMGDRQYSLARGQTRTHQVCRRRDLTFVWRSADGEEETIEPNPGDRYVVTKGRTLERQAGPETPE